MLALGHFTLRDPMACKLSALEITEIQGQPAGGHLSGRLQGIRTLFSAPALRAHPHPEGRARALREELPNDEPRMGSDLLVVVRRQVEVR